MWYEARHERHAACKGSQFLSSDHRLLENFFEGGLQFGHLFFRDRYDDAALALDDLDGGSNPLDSFATFCLLELYRESGNSKPEEKIRELFDCFGLVSLQHHGRVVHIDLKARGW